MKTTPRKHMFATAGLLAAGLSLFAPTGANAAITTMKDSASFTYLYEMNVNPSSQDLDTNSTSDWFAGTAGGETIPQTYTGGVAYSSQSASTPQILFRTDFTGSIERTQLSADTPYTIEFRVAKTDGAQGSQGWFSAALQSPGTSQSLRVALKDDQVDVRTTGGVYAPYMSGTDFTTDFHTVRIAYEGSNNYYVWVDDTLLNTDLSTPIAGGNGSFNASGGWFIGDFSSDTAGDWKVDYIRFDAGAASAPITASVPAPAALPAGLALLGMTLIRRRRARIA